LKHSISYVVAVILAMLKAYIILEADNMTFIFIKKGIDEF